jgi:hypothetical protein
VAKGQAGSVAGKLTHEKVTKNFFKGQLGNLAVNLGVVLKEHQNNPQE